METSSSTEKEESSIFKRSSRVKRSKKFFDDDDISNQTNKNKLKTKLPIKGKTNKKLMLAGVENDKSSIAPEEKRSECVDDEDLWLEALEKGELDDNGEIPKVRDPSLLTARQRALLDRTSSILVEEISPISKEETEEERKKRLEKNRQRKIQAVKKAKETQKQTIRKLIEIPKTSKDKQKTAQTNQNSNKPIPPMVKYINNANSCTLSFPKGYDYPLAKATAARPIPIRLCVVCGAKRRYSCSKTKVSLCSLKCYKENFRGSELVP